MPMSTHSLCNGRDMGRTTTLIPILAIAGAAVAFFLYPRSDTVPTDPSAPRPAGAAKEMPAPATQTLALRDNLYGDLSLLDACDTLVPLNLQLRELVEGEKLADARDLLESKPSKSSFAEKPIYWSALARIREELGDPVGAIDAAKHFHKLADEADDSRLEYAAIRLLNELRPETKQRAGDTEVLGVICEIGATDGLVVVAGFFDGQARLLLGDGGGVIGNTAGNERIAAAAQQVVFAATPIAPKWSVRRNRSLPETGQARIVLLTPAGTRIHETSIDELDNGETAARPVWKAIQNLESALQPLARAGS